MFLIIKISEPTCSFMLLVVCAFTVRLVLGREKLQIAMHSWRWEQDTIEHIRRSVRNNGWNRSSSAWMRLGIRGICKSLKAFTHEEQRVEATERVCGLDNCAVRQSQNCLYEFQSLSFPVSQ